MSHRVPTSVALREHGGTGNTMGKRADPHRARGSALCGQWLLLDRKHHETGSALARLCTGPVGTRLGAVGGIKRLAGDKVCENSVLHLDSVSCRELSQAVPACLIYTPTMYHRVPPLGAHRIHGGRGTPVGFWCSTEHLSPLAEHYATLSFFKVVYRPIGKVVLNLLFQGFFQVKVGEFQVRFKGCGCKGLLCHIDLLLNEHSHDVPSGATLRGTSGTRWRRNSTLYTETGRERTLPVCRIPDRRGSNPAGATTKPMNTERPTMPYRPNSWVNTPPRGVRVYGSRLP